MGKFYKNYFVSEVPKQCADHVDTTLCFFTSGHLCLYFISMGLGVNNIFGVLTLLYNFENKMIAF